jgi:hypothetical protein
VEPNANISDRGERLVAGILGCSKCGLGSTSGADPSIDDPAKSVNLTFSAQSSSTLCGPISTCSNTARMGMLKSLRNLGCPAQDILACGQLFIIAEVSEPFAERVLEAFEDEHVLMYEEHLSDIGVGARALVDGAFYGELV